MAAAPQVAKPLRANGAGVAQRVGGGGVLHGPQGCARPPRRGHDPGVEVADRRVPAPAWVAPRGALAARPRPPHADAAVVGFAAAGGVPPPEGVTVGRGAPRAVAAHGTHTRGPPVLC